MPASLVECTMYRFVCVSNAIIYFLDLFDNRAAKMFGGEYASSAKSDFPEVEAGHNPLDRVSHQKNVFGFWSEIFQVMRNGDTLFSSLGNNRRMCESRRPVLLSDESCLHQ